MTLELKELDSVTRGHMLAALEDDVASGRLEVPPLLTREGRSAYVGCLRDAVRRGNEVTLARSLQDSAWWRELDGDGVPVEIGQAAAGLAATEFGALYTAGRCIRLLKEGERQCRIYLAGSEPEPECVGTRVEGAVVSVSDVLMGHRGDGRSALRIPFSPSCRHSICRVDDVVAQRCPRCDAPMYYGVITQTYFCAACKHSITRGEMLRDQGILARRQGVAKDTGAAPPPDTLHNSPERPVLLAACAKGHIVDSMVVEPSVYLGAFCATCGRPIAVSCPGCGSPIRRVPAGAPVFPLPDHARPPNYCTKCAARFPWATRARQVRHMCSDAWGRLCGIRWVRRNSGVIRIVIVLASLITGAIGISQNLSK